MPTTLKALFFGSLVMVGCAGRSSLDVGSTPSAPAGAASAGAAHNAAENSSGSMGEPAGTNGDAPPHDDPTPSSLHITAPATLALGASARLTVTLHTGHGESDVTDSIVWVSSDATILTVDGGANATAMAEGSADLSATYGELSAHVLITVGPAAITSVVVTAPTDPLLILDPADLTATAVYSDGQTVDVTALATFTTSDDHVAIAVTGTSQVRASGGGTATITATYEGIAGTAALTVDGPALVGIALDPPSMTMATGEQQWLTISSLFADGTTGGVPQSSYLLTSDAPDSVSAMSNPDFMGMVAAMGCGHAVLTARYASLSATATIDVTN
ncbi:MAG: hypothetical protein JWN44_4781 [Myxococcales bacterium]|nr:hypothetical protein [Myxococcales bacterium]